MLPYKDKEQKLKKKIILRIFSILVCLGLLGVAAIFGINAAVKGTTKGKILTSQQAAELTDVDCILVLGCGVKSDGSPSDMLHDRLQRGVELYDLGAAPKLLMTGDHTLLGEKNVLSGNELVD